MSTALAFFVNAGIKFFFLQEVYQESLSHLALCQQHMSREEAIDWTGTDTLERIRTLMVASYEASGPGARHGPILVQGSHGTGKSSIIGAVYSNCEAWFGRRLLRIVRFSGATPRSAYNLELLRIICQQLCLLLHLSDGFLPKAHLSILCTLITGSRRLYAVLKRLLLTNYLSFSLTIFTV